jgi:predicted nucleic acid-binding Zn ribbon protein
MPKVRYLEITQRITDKSLGKCPTCKAGQAHFNTSFQLKGTGWYITDYARKGKDGGAVKGENGSKSSSESKTESKTEPKTESKIESAKSGGEKSSSTASSSTSAL